MQVKFGFFAKDRDSTKRPPDNFGDLITDCKFKEPTSLTHPVFIVNSTNQYNYVKMEGRYYFVDEIIRVTNTISEYHCTVDALATWKSAIGSSTQYVTRSQYLYDEYLVDTMYPIKNKKTSTSQTIPSLHAKMWDTLQLGWFMVGLFTRGDGTSGGITYYVMTPGQFRTFCHAVFDISHYGVSIDEVSYGLQQMLVNPIQYIASVYWYPTTEKPSGVLESQVKYGFWYAPNVNGFRVPPENRKISMFGGVTLPEHPKATAFKYLNGSPFTRYTLNCYMFGTVPLDPTFFIDNHECHFEIAVDTFTGDGSLTVTDDLGNIVARRFAKVGVNVPIAQIMPDLTGAVTSVAGAAGSLFSGNIVGAISGIASAAGSIMPQVTTTGTEGSLISYDRPATVLSEFYDVANYDPEIYGFPLCQIRQIDQTGGGFLKVENPHIELVATSEELTMVESAMENGFYYE